MLSAAEPTNRPALLSITVTCPAAHREAHPVMDVRRERRRQEGRVGHPPVKEPLPRSSAEKAGVCSGAIVQNEDGAEHAGL